MLLLINEKMELSKADFHDCCCPCCGQFDLKILSGKHHCKPKKERKDNQWIWPNLNGDMIRQAKTADEPSQAEQLQDGLKQYDQD